MPAKVMVPLAIALSSRLRRASASRMGRPATAGMGGRGLQGQVLAAFVGGLGVVGHSLAAQVIQAHRLHLLPCLALCAGKSQQLGQYFACMQCLRLHGVQGLGPLYRVGAGSGHMALQGQ